MARKTSLLPLKPLVQTSDVEEVCSVLSRVYTPVKIEPTGRGVPFEFRMNRAVVGSLAIGAGWFRRGVEIHNEGALDKFLLSLARGGRGMGRHTGGDLPLIPGKSAAMASPLAAGRLVHSADYLSVTIAVGRQTMESALTALCGVTRSAPLQFAPHVDLSSGAGADVLRLIEFIAAEHGKDGSVLTSPLIAARLSDALVFAFLVGQHHNHTALLESRTRSAGPHYVRRIEEYLTARAAEPVSLSELSALTGVSIRAIQAGFKAHRGSSPMRFLAERRLDLANVRLRSARPGTAVAEVALDCGFTHLGRFSLAYRKRFGEAPSDTLRRTHGAKELLRDPDKPRARSG